MNVLNSPSCCCMTPLCFTLFPSGLQEKRYQVAFDCFHETFVRLHAASLSMSMVRWFLRVLAVTGDLGGSSEQSDIYSQSTASVRGRKRSLPLQTFHILNTLLRDYSPTGPAGCLFSQAYVWHLRENKRSVPPRGRAQRGSQTKKSTLMKARFIMRTNIVQIFDSGLDRGSQQAFINSDAWRCCGSRL